MSNTLTSTLRNSVSDNARELKMLASIQYRADGKRTAKDPVARNLEGPLATSGDYREVFLKEMSSLYLLSFLLTASHKLAADCFSDGFSECIIGLPVSREWAKPWAKHTLIRNAIRIIDPCVRSAGRVCAGTPSKSDSDLSWNLPNETFLGNVLMLETFARFVVVISVLEGYLDQDCASFLGTSKRRVQNSRIRASRELANAGVL
jgi:hypothetical protein